MTAPHGKNVCWVCKLVISNIDNDRGHLKTLLKLSALKRWQQKYFQLGKRPSAKERREFLLNMKCSTDGKNRLVRNYFVVCVQVSLSLPIIIHLLTLFFPVPVLKVLAVLSIKLDFSSDNK